MTTDLASTRELLVRRAHTAAEIDAVLVGRHRVYSEEHDFFEPAADARIHDRFDAYPETTVHLVAELDGCIVGGVRYCIDDRRVGLPVDEVFDFSAHVGPRDLLACGSMLFVLGDAERRGIATWLILGGEAWAAELEASVMVGVVNPAITRLFGRLGYNPVASGQRRPNGLPFVPVVKRLRQDRPAVPTWIDVR
jgi:GNAT superfamily N-acetyltransferase